jgi:aminoglycoside phosphotransferase (APT) family kinase protein
MAGPAAGGRDRKRGAGEWFVRETRAMEIGAKEDLCLPLVAGHVSTGVPVPVATGKPGAGYPFPWSVRRWITGTTPDRDRELHRVGLPEDAWSRARGWALWKALVTVCDPTSPLYPQQARALDELVAERRDT